MTLQELKKAVEAKENRLYIFAGEEEYLKRYWLSEIRKSILTDPAFDTFNHLSYEGERLDLGLLSEALAMPPMMADRKLVEWHLLRVDALTEKELDALSEMRDMLLENDAATLVFYVQPEDFDVGSLPKKPSKMYTKLSKFADIVVFERATDHQLLSWIQRRFGVEQIRVLPAVAETLLSRVGHSMDVLAGEIDKLSAYLHSKGREELSPADIAFVSVSAIESDAFALSNALLAGDARLAYRALRDMKFRQLQPTFVLSGVTSVYNELYRVALLLSDNLSAGEIAKQLRIHEYKAGLYIKAVRNLSPDKLLLVVNACLSADVSMKSGGQTGYGVIERLLPEILTLLR